MSATKAAKTRMPPPATEKVVETNPDAARWDDEADVIVVGFGGAGACAALEAKERGAHVIVLERFQGGGATRLSGGVLYAGGGTHIQREAGVEDDVENLFKYLELEVKDAVSKETLRDFCNQSLDSFGWLEKHGVPFEATLCPVKTSYPTDDYYLYYSGNESFVPFRDAAKPAPRGHRAKGTGLPGGSFYDPLKKSAHALGVDVRYESRVERLVTDASGRVIGVEYFALPAGRVVTLVRALYAAALAMRNYNPQMSRKLYDRIFEIELREGRKRRARARKGVILSAGGFIYNREMVEQYAPKYRKGMPLGSVADSGSGIELGRSVGGAIDRMSRVSAWRFINPPEAWTRGVIVNNQGKRYINEMMYGAAIGEAMVERNEGRALLILDKRMKDTSREQCKPGKAQWFQRAPALLNLWFNAKEGRTVEELAKRIRVPADELARTIAEYNAGCASGADAFGKPKSQLQPFGDGPFYAIDCSIDSKRFPCPTLTLGGLVVDEKSGHVKREDGSRIEGLFAAGRTAVGVCSQQYVSGLSIADCVYSGRRAGRVAATSA